MKHDYMLLQFFTQNEEFPFFIHYGGHDENVRMHTHKDFSELTIVLSGTATHRVNDEAFFLKKGDVFVIAADTAHGYENTNEFKICNIMYNDEFFFKDSEVQKHPGFQALFVIEPVMRQKSRFSNMLTLSLSEFEEVKHMIKKMVAEYELGTGESKACLQSYFILLAVQFSRLYVQSATHSASEAYSIASAVSFLENNFADNISVEALSEIAGLSPRHFTRRFHEIYRTTPVKYLQGIRMQRACYLLESSELAITEIALQCGFSDSNYFSRLFRKLHGITPSQYKRKTT